MERHERIQRLIADMSVGEKRWFARALSGMILADGIIDEEEIQAMKGFIGLVQDQDIQDEVNSILSMRMDVTLEHESFSPSHAVQILMEVASMSLADGHFASEEETFIAYVGKQLGLNRMIQTEAIRLAQLEANVIEQKINLIEQAGK